MLVLQENVENEIYEKTILFRINSTNFAVYIENVKDKTVRFLYPENCYYKSNDDESTLELYFDSYIEIINGRNNERRNIRINRKQEGRIKLTFLYSNIKNIYYYNRHIFSPDVINLTNVKNASNLRDYFRKFYLNFIIEFGNFSGSIYLKKNENKFYEYNISDIKSFNKDTVKYLNDFLNNEMEKGNVYINKILNSNVTSFSIHITLNLCIIKFYDDEEKMYFYEFTLQDVITLTLNKFILDFYEDVVDNGCSESNNIQFMFERLFESLNSNYNIDMNSSLNFYDYNKYILFENLFIYLKNYNKENLLEIFY